jgi:hypothetical protein
MIKIFRKTDIALIALFLVLAASWYFILIALGLSADAGVVIIVSNDETYTLSMQEYNGQTFTVTTNRGTNHILIEGGTARMIYSDCPDHDCVHMGAISNTLQSITCLPNRVHVRLEGVGTEGSEVDTTIR